MDTTTSENTSSSSAKDLNGFKIGYCSPLLNGPFYVVLSEVIQKKTEAMGMRFFSADGQGDITKQIAAVEDLLSKGIDALIINPLDYKALIPAINDASKSGIPVFVVDSYIDEKAQYITSVQADNQKNGELIGNWIAKKMYNKPIKAVVISGAQGNKIGKEKRQGVFRGITEQQLRSQGKASLEILGQGWGNWSNNGGLKAMEDLLVSHPDLNVLIAENDAMAMGAIKAIEEARKTDKILTIGFDGQKEAYQMIQQGKLGITSVNSPKALREIILDLTVKYLKGERDLPKLIHSPAIAVTKENVNKYYDPKAAF
ncbi:substrate-binding domain-containing protein [Bacteroidetes bacterium endosymbiont of Geopemphigus sp.]|uniref:substrate-binding domain-containing protein n=1 Tax=Bacteroidetes bacterium endosymbiont of Geopemphigus sp. TaxID=2047937 RepID=UPI0018A8281E|nr:substrate-binding domain-containing protein [Bacteroidetes bacterium endosymbiont of Geopemphigus sp.]